MILDFNDRNFKFYPEFEYYCFKNCFLQILEYYGVQNAKYFLDCTTDWTYQVDENHDVVFGTGDPYSGFIQPYDNLVKIYTTDEISKDEIWKNNIEKITNGIPIIIAVDIFYLKYTPYYQKKHSYHSAVLTGYDEVTDEFYLVDWYPPWFYKGKISREELEDARKSLNEGDGVLSGVPIKYLYAEVEKKEINESIENLIKIQLQKNIYQYYNTDDNQYETKGYIAIKSVMEKIEEYIRNSNEEQKSFFEKIYGELFFTPYRKKLFYWYLNNAFSDLNNFGFVKPLSVLDETISEWKGLLSLLIKCSMLASNENLELLLNRCQEILEKEKKLSYELYELNRSI